MRYETGALLPRASGKTQRTLEALETAVHDLLHNRGTQTDFVIGFVFHKKAIGKDLIKRFDKMIADRIDVLAPNDDGKVFLSKGVKYYDMIIDTGALSSSHTISLTFIHG